MRAENEIVQRRIRRQAKRRRRRKRRLRLLRGIVSVTCICAMLYIGYTVGAVFHGIHSENAVGRTEDEKHIEIILQEPMLPNGCEAVSMTMLLRSYGAEADAVTLALEYLPRMDFSYSGNIRYGPDPEELFAGDPSSPKNGWYCFEQPLVEGANRYLNDLGSSLVARTITGASFSKLKRYVQNGTPAVVWITSDYETPRYNSGFTWILPDGSEYIPYSNLHCVVMTKIEEDNVHLADPFQGEVVIPQQLCKNLYEQMGQRAVILE